MKFSPGRPVAGWTYAVYYQRTGSLIGSARTLIGARKLARQQRIGLYQISRIHDETGDVEPVETLAVFRRRRARA